MRDAGRRRPAAEGAIVVRPRGGGSVRVPFAIAFAPRRLPLLGGVELSHASLRPSDTRPAVLTLRAGRVRTVGGADEVQPVARLDIELSTAGGLARRRDRPAARRAARAATRSRLTGRDPGGQALDAGPLPRSACSAYPSGGGAPTRRSVLFEIL